MLQVKGSQQLSYNKFKTVGIWLFVSAALYIVASYNYLLFHTAAEGFSIIVAALIYVLATRTYRYSGSDFLLFIGNAYFFIAILDFFHTIVYKGMGVFQGFDTNAPTQLWIAGRYVEAVSLFLAPFFIQRAFPRAAGFASYALVTSLLILSVIWARVFPVCFIEGHGLTEFKITSEYIICLILLLAIGHLIRRKNQMNLHLYKTISLAMTITILSELCFTLYTDAYGFMNFAGHMFKLLSSFLIYRGVVLRGLISPYDIIFEELNESKEKYRNEQQQLSDIIEFLPDATFVIDQDRRVIAWNRAIEEMTGVEKGEIVGKGDYEYSVPFYGRKRPILIDYVFPNTEISETDYENITKRGNMFYAENYIPLINKGRGAYLWHKASPLLDSNGNIVGAIESLRDITKHKQIEEKFKNLSTVDGLTGIANRRHFEECLNREWGRAIRDAKPLSLLMCDIDYFKLYNDNYGHLNGDICLKKVVESLSNALKRTGDLVARYGGEEFAVILPETDLAGATFVAENLRAGVEALGIRHESSRVSDYLTVSLGVATAVPTTDTEAAKLLDLADQALYRAKREGRNRVVSIQYQTKTDSFVNK